MTAKCCPWRLCRMATRSARVHATHRSGPNRPPGKGLPTPSIVDNWPTRSREPAQPRHEPPMLGVIHRFPGRGATRALGRVRLAAGKGDPAHEPSTTTSRNGVHHACPGGGPVRHHPAGRLHPTHTHPDSTPNPYLAVHPRSRRRNPEALHRVRTPRNVEEASPLRRSGTGLQATLRRRRQAPDGLSRSEDDRRHPRDRGGSLLG